MTPIPSSKGPGNRALGSAASSGNVIAILVRIGRQDAPVMRFVGRMAWTLAQLIAAGERGVAPLERPAPRWSHYIFLLRGKGVPIATEEERHGGAYSGRHGHYRLTAAVFVVREVLR